VKGKEVQVWKYYKVEGGTLTRLRRECPRCGPGVFMAQHADRLYCGRCGHTMWLSSGSGSGSKSAGSRGTGRGRRR
jgi:small subunit ribosomal protein S27Ae